MIDLPPVTDHPRALSLLATFLRPHFEVTGELDVHALLPLEYHRDRSETHVEYEARGGDRVGHAMVSTSEFGSSYLFIGGGRRGSDDLVLRSAPEHLETEGASIADVTALRTLAVGEDAAVRALSEELGAVGARGVRVLPFADAWGLVSWSLLASAAEVGGVTTALRAVLSGAPPGWAARRVPVRADG